MRVDQGAKEHLFLLQRVQPAMAGVSITLGGLIIVGISAAIGAAG
jgi:hypothetical protein